MPFTFALVLVEGCQRGTFPICRRLVKRLSNLDQEGFEKKLQKWTLQGPLKVVVA